MRDPHSFPHFPPHLTVPQLQSVSDATDTAVDCLSTEDGAHASGGVMRAFHPAVANWFAERFAGPTPAQAAAWPVIQQGRSILVAAPTGSGKTLTAFLAALDALITQGVAAHGVLPDETVVVYVSPLKALSNDIQLNLIAPLAGMTDALRRMGVPESDIPQIRTAVRTGDTPQRERTAMSKRPPHIVVTTPESLYVLLGSDSGRRMLRTVRTVIVDEIHAVAGNKRGSHLALSLARLEALCGHLLTRIGLSATQQPIEKVAAFLVGMQNATQRVAPADHLAARHAQNPADRSRHCAIVNVGHNRPRDLALEVPPVPLEAVMSNEVWERVYDRLAELIAQHTTTLVFVNTRRMAERVARHLGDRLGNAHVAAHHGSLAKEYRLSAEQRLKGGALKVLVATASLELGIDIGDVDLVCQIGSPRSIASFLQRVGRSGHHVGGTPKGRLFPTSRDDLIECAALLDCVRRGELDVLTLPSAPLDVLAQQIVAEVSCQEWSETALFEMVQRAYPYADLSRERYDAVVQMLCTGYTGRQGPRAAYVHRDTINGTLRARRGAKLTAVSAGGTIPENADFTVLLEPQSMSIGTVNEDFAVESLAGDIFQLGNASYRILKIETGKVRVEDAHGQPPNIPFWLGEAPGRTDALSHGVARLRGELDALFGRAQGDEGNVLAEQWLTQTIGLTVSASSQIVDYLARARMALGVLPTGDTLVMERFFDESGGTQLVMHTPFGSRVNRAWGLALRKRFCRTFNFELQAAATEDAIVFSLSTSHSFALDEVWRYLHSQSAEHVLIQALLDAPLFGVRWRWNATTALALPRFAGGNKVAPQLQRMKSDDLLATVFPDQVACLENIVGERALPSHPLVEQTVDDCLHEAMDAGGWLAILRRMEAGDIQLVSRDLPAPSPLAAEILNARPYAFLDDAPLEERRTQAVLRRRWTEPTAADDMGALDAEAIASVRDEAWPQVRSADEMHEALVGLACISETEVQRQPDSVAWSGWLAELVRTGHVTKMAVAQNDALWVPLERLACLQAIYPEAVCDPARIAYPDGIANDAMRTWTEADALVDVIRARMTGVGPLSIAQIARPLTLAASRVAVALTTLEAEGYLIRGYFTVGKSADESEDESEATPLAAKMEWCERRLLARIHRYTVKRLRREIEPVAPRDFQRFLFEWQHLTPGTRTQGRDALSEVLAQLEGFQAAAAGWEEAILPARVAEYEPAWLDELCRSGRFAWMRLSQWTPQRTRATDTASTAFLTTGMRDAALTLASAMQPARRSTGATGATGTTGTTASTQMLAPTASTIAAAKLANLVGSPNSTPAAPIRTTPVVLLSRRRLADWAGLIPPADSEGRSSRAQAVHDILRKHGAMFFDEIASSVRLLPMELEGALGELVAAGEVSADSFAGLRALIAPTVRRNPWGGAGAGPRGRRHHARFSGGMEDAGRWALLRRDPIVMPEMPPAPAPAPIADAISIPNQDAIEHIAMTLLRRYGVVFWRVLAREADWLPSWRDLLRVYHRLEARGDIRGGRFVDGVGGEQFALPEAIPVLRAIRKQAHDQQWQTLSAIDPLNLVGTVLAGEKIPAIVGNRIAFLDGVPAGWLVAGKFHYAVDLPSAQRALARHLLSMR